MKAPPTASIPDIEEHRLFQLYLQQLREKLEAACDGDEEDTFDGYGEFDLLMEELEKFQLQDECNPTKEEVKQYLAA